MENPLKKRSFFLDGALLHELGSDKSAGIFTVAAVTQEIFNVLIGKRKSEGLLVKALPCDKCILPSRKSSVV